MRKKFFISLILSLLTVYSFGQDTMSYKSKWQVKPSFGFNIPMTKLLKGDVTDYLFGFDDHAFYCQVLSISYFFHKHWGVEFNFQPSISNRISKRGDKFLQSMESEYGNDYFVTPLTGPSYDNPIIFPGNFDRGYLGLIYRLESKRFFIYPKIAIGVTSFYTDWGHAYLKEKNSNKVLTVSYSSGDRPNDYLTIAPSLTLGYKLTKRMFFNVDLLTSYYKTNITFVKTTTDLNSGQSFNEETVYKKNMFNLSLGAGLIIVIY